MGGGESIRAGRTSRIAAAGGEGEGGFGGIDAILPPQRGGREEKNYFRRKKEGRLASTVEGCESMLEAANIKRHGQLP